MRLIVVDGYNVIHGSARYRFFLEREMQAARDVLVADVAAWCDSDDRVYIVFDGSHDSGAEDIDLRSPGVTAVYTGEERDADSVIEAIVARHADSVDQLVVVSSDRQVRSTTAGGKVLNLSVSGFEQEIATAAESRSENKGSHMRVRIEDRIDLRVKRMMNKMSGRIDDQ